MIEYPYQTNTPDWMESRRGVITASRAKDIRRSDGLTAQQRLYVNAIRAGRSEDAAKEAAGYKALPKSEAVQKAIDGTLELVFSDAAHGYAKELARERCGGKEPEGFQGLAQRVGHEEEEFAAIEYMVKTGREVELAYFVTTDDRKFGMSLDRWVGGYVRALEVKTMVSSTTLFKVMVDGDIDEYRDQCLFGLWHFTLPVIDLALWCPDLQALHIIPIERDEEELQKLEDDAIAFDALVCEYEAKLRAKVTGQAVNFVPPPGRPFAGAVASRDSTSRAPVSAPASPSKPAIKPTTTKAPAEALAPDF